MGVSSRHVQLPNGRYSVAGQHGQGELFCQFVAEGHL